MLPIFVLTRFISVRFFVNCYLEQDVLATVVDKVEAFYSFVFRISSPVNRLCKGFPFIFYLARKF